MRWQLSACLFAFTNMYLNREQNADSVWQHRRTVKETAVLNGILSEVIRSMQIVNRSLSSVKSTTKFIQLVLLPSLLIYCVWGAPPRPVRTLYSLLHIYQCLNRLNANIPRHLCGTRKAVSATPQAEAKQRPGRKPQPPED